MTTSIESKLCSKCKEVKLLGEFSKDKDKRDGYRSNCKACQKERDAKYYAANLEKIKAQRYSYRELNREKAVKRMSEWSKANPKKVRAQQAKYYAANPEKIKERHAKYRLANSENLKERQAEYQKANPEKCRAWSSNRRAAKLLALPKWLTKEDYQTIEAIYKEANRLTEKTGLIYHVDHIHPLQGKLVCGFHCPANLQILTDAENCSKKNKFTPYVESELTY